MTHGKHYEKTKFIKISNNNDPTDFIIDITTMRDDRLRIASLKSQYIRYLENPDKYPYRDVYRFFNLDYSFYCLDTDSFNNYTECKAHRDKLIQEQNTKMKNTPTQSPSHDKPIIIRFN